MDCKGTHFFGITIYMHLFFRDFRAFCAFIDTYFLSFLKTNKHLFIHDILTGFFSAGCHTLPQIAATRLRQAPAQPESRCNRLIRKPIPTIRYHRSGQRRNTPSATPPSAGQTREPPVAPARTVLTQATDKKKDRGRKTPVPPTSFRQSFGAITIGRGHQHPNQLFLLTEVVTHQRHGCLVAGLRRLGEQLALLAD